MPLHWLLDLGGFFFRFFFFVLSIIRGGSIEILGYFGGGLSLLVPEIESYL